MILMNEWSSDFCHTLLNEYFDHASSTEGRQISDRMSMIEPTGDQFLNFFCSLLLSSLIKLKKKRPKSVTKKEMSIYFFSTENSS